MKKQAPYKSTDEFLEKKGITVSQKSSRKDIRTAQKFMQALGSIESFIFEEKANVNLFDATNSWGIEATYHFEGRDGSYDIYIPNLVSKLQKVLVLSPQKAYLKDLNRKLIFVASHKIRHRLQKEKDLICFTPDYNSPNPLINKIIREVENNRNHDECACSILEEPNRLQEIEFDAIVAQHYILTRLGQISTYSNLSDVPVYLWKSIANDLWIQPE
ncbi:MAG: hypothetical protein ACOCRX_09870 [Candidatus Woesearchaeota archaeon]